MFRRVKVVAITAFLFSGLLSTPSQAATTCSSTSTNHGGYIYTAFKTAGTACTWDVPYGISAVDMLVVAGGGGGGPRHSGGGGAGGVIKANSVSMTNISTLSITVGAGGAGAYLSGSTVEATNGSNSIVAKSAGSGTLATQTAIGGGRGSQSSPSTGGSGGGTYSGSGAAGTSGQGSAGATGGSSSGWYGGGGGGAGGGGYNGTSSGGGAGGVGTTWFSAFDTTTATRLKLTDKTGYFGGGGGGGITASSGPVSGGAGGIGGGGNGGGDGAILSLGRSGATGAPGTANTGGGGGGAGLKQVTGTDSPGGAGGSGVVILRYAISDNVQLSNYGPATYCTWGVGQNYGYLMNSGTANAITKMRFQFEANAADASFEATRIEIWSNNAGATGNLVGKLRPSALAASSTAAGASLATRVGTYVGSIHVTPNTQYWFVLKSGGYVLTACQASGMVTQANSWSMVLDNGSYRMLVGGSYMSYGLNVMAFEITTGTPDYLSPEVTGPSSSIADNVYETTLENASFSNTYTANEWVEWSKFGNDSGLFSLSTSGVLALTGRNFESPGDANGDNIFEVAVVATDVGGNQTVQALYLTITDDNEYPYFITGGGGMSHSISVAENQTSVTTYSGADPDTATTLSWRIAGGLDSSLFSINSSTGVIVFLSAPDYELPTDSNANNSYLVTISVSDGVNEEFQSLTVNITNVNEIAGIAKPTVSAQLYKGSIAQISVVAETPGKVRFFIDGRRIGSCLAVSTTGSAPTATATCSFKPALQGVHNLTARITPSNSSLTGTTSPALTVTIGRRASAR